jgi:hypothetical protein
MAYVFYIGRAKSVNTTGTPASRVGKGRVGDRQPSSPGRRPVLPGLVRLSSDAVQNPHVIKGRRTLGFELGLIPILFQPLLPPQGDPIRV